MIIWGSRTKHQGRGFIFRPCPSCQSDQVHFVAEIKSKFTLYFISTFTMSSKAVLICTQCERAEAVEGPQGQWYLKAAVSREQALDELRRLQPPLEAAGANPSPPIHTLAVAMVVLATEVSLSDGRMDEAEAAAIGQAFATIHSATTSEPVKDAAGLVIAKLGEIMTWIASPATGPVALMLAEAGRVLRQTPMTDQHRFVGQMAWLCDTVAVASGGVSGAELAQMDAGLAALGYGPMEVATALAFCDHNGG